MPVQHKHISRLWQPKGFESLVMFTVQYGHSFVCVWNWLNRKILEKHEALLVSSYWIPKNICLMQNKTRNIKVDKLRNSKTLNVCWWNNESQNDETFKISYLCVLFLL